jgi:hypothetical protein
MSWGLALTVRLATCRKLSGKSGLRKPARTGFERERQAGHSCAQCRQDEPHQPILVIKQCRRNGRVGTSSSIQYGYDLDKRRNVRHTQILTAQLLARTLRTSPPERELGDCKTRSRNVQFQPQQRELLKGNAHSSSYADFSVVIQFWREQRSLHRLLIPEKVVSAGAIVVTNAEDNTF